MDKKVVTSIVFPEKLWKRIKRRAFEEEISLGELIRKGMEKYLKETKKGKGG